MAYDFYLDGVQYPVPPEKLEVKIKGGNKTATLADGAEINLLGVPGLTDVSFTATLPGMRYPYAVYPDGFHPPRYYLDRLEALMLGKRAFQLLVSRALPDGTPLHYTRMTATLEEYTITDDAKAGFDTTVKISLKQYAPHMTGLGVIEQNADGTFTATPQAVRPAGQDIPAAYTVRAGDTLLSIAKQFLGSDTLYTALAVKNGLTNPCALAVGTVIRLDL